jgi:ferredoxin
VADGQARDAVHIDWTRCDGRGLCAELLPDHISRDKWGYPVATRGAPADRSTIPMTPPFLEAAEEAVALCPVLALSLMRITVRS